MGKGCSGPTDDVGPQKFQQRVDHHDGYESDNQEKQGICGVVWQDPVVDLQDRQRQGKCHTVDEDRCRVHGFRHSGFAHFFAVRRIDETQRPE